MRDSFYEHVKSGEKHLNDLESQILRYIISLRGDLEQATSKGIAAHFFVFYFGIVADITPPVALAAYAGSAIAKSDPMKTGINATKLAIAAFIVPYIFAMNPSMLLMDQGVLAAIQVIITSCLGIFGIAAALEGYVVARAPWWQRILLAAGGLCLIDPSLMTDIVGVAAIVIVVVLQIVMRKRSKPVAA